MREENEMTDITTNGFVPIDFTRLPKLEAVIKRGLSTFLQVGRALLEIHDGRLYAAEYRTFEDYCSQRWKLSVQRGYQLIDAAKVIDAVSTTVEIEPPQSERAARELAETLRHEGPEAAAEAWQHAVEQHGSQPTAEQVRRRCAARVGRLAARISCSSSRTVSAAGSRSSSALSSTTWATSRCPSASASSSPSAPCSARTPPWTYSTRWPRVSRPISTSSTAR
jgi:hypothetical protein